jgi:archaellum component FlaC
LDLKALAMQVAEAVHASLKDEFKHIHERLDQVEKRLNRVEERLDHLEEVVGTLEKGQKRMQEAVNELEYELREKPETSKYLLEDTL